MKKYITCTRCIMDNSSDDTITFDENGYCNYCTEALTRKEITYFPNEKGKQKLDELIAMVKKDGKGKKYDCIMGISGGLDSSYLLYLGSKWGLRILAIHVDDGFDTEISKRNLASLVEKTGIDYIQMTPDAEQFNDLNRAYFLAGVPNLAVPQDNVLFSCIYEYARINKIKYFLSGGNFALESILQSGNTYTVYDKTNIKDIHKKFGSKPMNKLPIMSEYRRMLDSFILKISSPRPLNYIDYNKEKAIKELNDFCGFEYYGRKHHENFLTRFIQEYYFYKKFDVDKRTSHLSSMIVSGQMTRDEALKAMKEPLMTYEDLKDDIDIILEAFSLTEVEFHNTMEHPPKQHTDYKTSKYNLLVSIVRLIGKFRKKL